MTPDYEAWRFWVQVGAFIGSVAAAIYSWWVARNRRTMSAIEDNEKKAAELERRIGDVERDLHHMPTQKDIKELAGHISKLHGEMKQLSGTMQGVSRAVDLMNTYLIERERP